MAWKWKHAAQSGKKLVRYPRYDHEVIRYLSVSRQTSSAGPIWKILVRLIPWIFKLQVPTKKCYCRYYWYCNYIVKYLPILAVTVTKNSQKKDKNILSMPVLWSTYCVKNLLSCAKNAKFLQKYLLCTWEKQKQNDISNHGQKIALVLNNLVLSYPFSSIKQLHQGKAWLAHLGHTIKWWSCLSMWRESNSLE